VRKLAAFVAVAALVLAAQAAALAAPVQLGIFGNIDRFHSLTGQQSQVGHVIVGWGQSTFAQIWPQLGPVPMLGFDNGQGTMTMQALARGTGDAYLLAMSESARGLGKPVYIRPLGEMNGHWNAYCAYNTNGTPRGIAYSTANFRKAFARIYLIMHGGPTVNATLKRLGMPLVSTDIPTNPFVKVVWNPQGYGSPDVAGNSAQAYYPGDRYVDVVGDDLYDIGGKAEFAAADKLYKAHPSKPFSFPEWGLWGVDDPKFVQQMATFVKTHPRTKLLAYFNAKPGSIFDLASKPKSLAAYKRYILPLGR
jgi:hypothetical protein